MPVLQEKRYRIVSGGDANGQHGCGGRLLAAWLAAGPTLSQRVGPECATKAAMARIVTTQYRYKRPPKKRKPVTLTGPSIVATQRAHGERHKPKPPPPANDDEKPSPKQHRATEAQPVR